MICPGTKFSFTFFYLLYRNLPERGGPDSVAGTATRYELDGPEIESLCWRDFPYSTKSAPRPTQRPCKMRTGSVSGVKKTGLGDDHPTHHSAEVANGLLLYICRLSVLALACHGVTVWRKTGVLPATAAWLGVNRQICNYADFWTLQEELVSSDTERRNRIKRAWLSFLAKLNLSTHVRKRARRDSEICS